MPLLNLTFNISSVYVYGSSGLGFLLEMHNQSSLTELLFFDPRAVRFLLGSIRARLVGAEC